MDRLPLLHLHGQFAWHDDAAIVGNAEGLAALRELINHALEGNSPAQRTFFVSDGEGYRLTVKLRSARFGTPAWDGWRLPYTSQCANPDSDKELDLKNI